jgi:hypothetical protein
MYNSVQAVIIRIDEPVTCQPSTKNGKNNLGTEEDSSFRFLFIPVKLKKLTWQRESVPYKVSMVLQQR